MKFIVLPVENWGREFESKLYLIECIEKQTTEKVFVLVAPKRIVNLMMVLGLSGAGILHKSIQEHHISAVAKAVGHRCAYFFLEEESIHRNISLDARFGRAVPFVSKAFATTDDDYASLLKKYPSEVIERTGNPRFDFLFSMHPVHIDRKKSIQNRFGEFYLFSSNFSFVFPPDDHSLSNLEKEGIWKSNEERENLHQYIEEHRERALKVCDWLKSESEKKCIIYRPHPLESISLVEKFFSGSNVHVVREGSITPWLMACKGLWHCGCTTAIEFALLGRSPVFLLPLESEVNDLPYEVSNVCKELSSIDLFEYDKASRQCYQQTDVLQKTFGNETAELVGNSSERVAHSIIKMAPKIRYLSVISNVFLAWVLDVWFRRKVERSQKEKSRLIDSPFLKAKSWRHFIVENVVEMKQEKLNKMFKVGRYCILIKIKP